MNVVFLVHVEQARAQHAHNGRRERDAERERGQDHVLDGVDEHIGTPREQRVDQQEAGDDRPLEARREPAREGQQLQRHTEQQDEE